jgi:flagella basal body P-ring formation protein FlgA
MRLIVLFIVAAGAVVFAAGTVSPQEAIAAAVRERVGALASVAVENVTTTVRDEAGLTARPDQAARLGQLARFELSVNGVRRGLVVAKVVVRMAYPRAARKIGRDEVVDASAISAIEGELSGVPIRALLAPDDVNGLKARRDIARGEPLTENILRVPPVVKSGDAVDATLHIGTVSVTTTGTASGSGQVGDVIRVMQPHSSRLLNARIVGPGAVEIVE